ncbi:ribbon-helix-helix protein, CopG family [Cellulomonas composti]|uniref:Ribbon-helix-helix protein CopG domain-containing protein n=1 Tax=Cellulomonas composti TaxID=266130 RepID=A0A511J7B1_9CELL|nr:ribbon-helix-helix protein, CopG family [Cellulomonas composti]GEL93887.1 hypothetical protein CCO02nite_05450 [Cellulomonas composti]
MPMTLRLSEDDEAKLRQLAAVTHRSLNDAVALAIRETAERHAVTAAYEVAIAQVEVDDAEALDRLSR